MRYLDSRPRVRVRTDLLGIVRIVHFLSLEGPFLASKASFDTKIRLERMEAAHGPPSPSRVRIVWLTDICYPHSRSDIWLHHKRYAI